MAAAVAGVGTYSGGTAASPLNVPFPTSPAPASGDVAIILVEGGNAAETASAPTGFTQIFQQSAGSGTSTTQLWIFAKVCDGTESGNAAVTLGGTINHASGRMLTVSGSNVADVTTDIVVGTGNSSTGNLTISAAGITLSANALNLLCCTYGRDFTSSAQFSAWSSANAGTMTERMDDGASAGTGGAVGCGSVVYTAGGDTGTDQATLVGNTDPWNAVQLGFNPAGAADATATPSTVAVVGAVPAPTAQGAAQSTPSAAAVVASVPVPTVAATAVATPSTVAVIAAVPAPTVLAGSPDATATPATVAVAGAVPAPTVLAAARTTPSSVAVVAAVPAPTVQAAARPTPGTVAATGAVPAPTVLGTARATPGTVAAISTVPAPTVRGAAITTPSSVAAVGSVPAPSVLVGGNSTAAPNTVAVIAAVPASTIQAAARSSPATAAMVAGVGAPTVRAGAVTSPTTVTVVTSVPTASFPGSIVVSITEGDPSPATLLEADGGSVGREVRTGVLVGVEGG